MGLGDITFSLSNYLDYLKVIKHIKVIFFPTMDLSQFKSCFFSIESELERFNSYYNISSSFIISYFTNRCHCLTHYIFKQQQKNPMYEFRSSVILINSILYQHGTVETLSSKFSKPRTPEAVRGWKKK